MLDRLVHRGRSRPSVLARTLIRHGLQSPRGSAELLDAVDALETAVAQLRAALE